MGLLLRKALTGFLYSRLLELPQYEISSANAGKLLSLASADMTLIERGAYELPYLLTSPLGTLL